MIFLSAQNEEIMSKSTDNEWNEVTSLIRSGASVDSKDKVYPICARYV